MKLSSSGHVPSTSSKPCPVVSHDCLIPIQNVPGPAHVDRQHFRGLQAPLSGTSSVPTLHVTAHPDKACKGSHIREKASPRRERKYCDGL